MDDIERLVEAVVEELPRAGLIQMEVSARHVHLCEADVEALFGPGAALTPRRELSQPGQFLSEQRVALEGPRGRLEHIAVLGPARSASQVELSRGDAKSLGVDAPLRESGDVAGSGGIVLEGPRGRVALVQGAIVAHSHLHMTPPAARALGLAEGDRVAVRALTRRPVIFSDVIVRVSERFRCRMHVDVDEANAAGIEGFTLGLLQGAGPGGTE